MESAPLRGRNNLSGFIHTLSATTPYIASESDIYKRVNDAGSI